jgi:hypothetical protein
VSYGGDSGNRIFVLYWRCPLIRVSVIRGSTVFYKVKTLSRVQEFHEDRLCDCRALLEFLLVLSIFHDRFGWNLVQELSI